MRGDFQRALAVGVAAACLCAWAQTLRLQPDYAGVSWPPNIAPCNFDIEGLSPKSAAQARLVAGNGEMLDAKMVREKAVGLVGARFPERGWRDFLSHHAGEDVRLEVWAEGRVLFTATNAIAVQKIDPNVTYRLIEPGYVGFGDIEICRRDLASFDEKVIHANYRTSRGQCINCHIPGGENSGDYLYHTRLVGSGTHVVSSRYGRFDVDLKAEGPVRTIGGGAYAAWHPSGDFIAFSQNKTRQYFPLGASPDPLIVYDLEGDLAVYSLADRKTIQVENAYDVLECFPAWSPDGKMLYSVQAQSPFKTPPENLGQDPKMERPPEEAVELATNLHYRVVRRAFDPMARTFGPPEKVMVDPMNRHSFTHPRISPDGRWLVVTCAPRGVFPIQQWQADLWMLDLKRRVVRPLVELNSAESDSYHNFDSSGRWFMFTSRRDDGSYTRLYFAAFDPEKGVFSKPFMLPQRRPLDNLRRFKSYNVPEFAR